ncbi:indole-3-acetic acid-amido synthetase GH3.6-like [Papaver somniferum]|uniref:indole-3-acetic acid-amido synthetase GH3.6-like n=1 Tax=Papaver somniferum TaxID=3469 RepID=UPI000E6FB52C|nr:indole-3-acetic acid-amido synthetase GH3.6-like [Papaver somniferum]
MTERDAILWQSNKDDHALDFLKDIPIDGLMQTLGPRPFRSVLQYCLGIPMFPEDSLCSSCNNFMDIFGDHALHCAKDVGQKYRHDLVNDVFADICYKAGVASRREASLGFGGSKHAESLFSAGKTAKIKVKCEFFIFIFFCFSSGTSGGERKIFPRFEEETERIRLGRCLVAPVVNKYITGMDKGKAMIFMFSKENAYTPAGLPFNSSLTLNYESSQFKNRSYDPSEDYTSPDETILCKDFYQSTYSQVLCGLYQSKLVVRVGSVFIYGLLRVILFIQKHWSLLCNDIRTGTINTQIIKDVSVQEAVKKILVKPDPELADFIEIECIRYESWKGIISRLWPNAKYIDAIITGSMSQHIPSVDFYSNSLPLVSARYICSECFLGINLNPLCKPNEVAYTFLPNMAYFEFLPILDANHQKNSNQQEQPDAQKLAELSNVKLGHEYEVFVTTYTGLYRYGIGDVLRVVGFKNTAPQFQFICRKKVLLSIDCEKTSELELDNAVQNAVKHLKSTFEISLVDYTSYADTTSTSNHGHYVIFWELRHHNSNVNKISTVSIRSMLEECCFKIEESLSSEYKENRALDKSIGPLEIKIVETGTFDKLMDCAVSQGTSVSQYKTPRCMKNVELLNSCVVSNYFSRESPHYAPGL